jgi:hypothetical protein
MKSLTRTGWETLGTTNKWLPDPRAASGYLAMSISRLGPGAHRRG